MKYSVSMSLSIAFTALVRENSLQGSLFLVDTSYCWFGTKYRGTRWIVVNRRALLRLSKPCRHSSHESILAGHSVPTKTANRYPAGLVRLWAHADAVAFIEQQQKKQ